MRILILPSWYPTPENPGSGVFFRDQAEALAEAGHDVTVMYIQLYSIKNVIGHVSKEPQFKEINGVKTYYYYACSYGADRRMRVCERVREVFPKAIKSLMDKEGNFDIVHAHSFRAAGYAAVVNKRLLGCPVIVTEHISSIGNDEITSLEKKHLKTTVEGANLFVCVSENLKTIVKEKTGTNKKILVIPNILPSVFSEAIAEEEEIKSDKLRFIAVGSLREIKRYDFMINAFADVFSNCRDVELRICGDGPARDKLKKLIEALSLEDKVKLLGYQSREDVRKQMLMSHVMLQASKSETFGVVLIEAMACGLPVIGTRNGGSNEVLEAYGANAVDVDDYDAYCEAIKEIAHTFKSYNRKLIRNNTLYKYGKKSIVELLEEAYKEALTFGK
ncbi:MAG: glycosyltransferase [Clostridiales bacterium]|nr:glycosyltransferase [Candidatus Crickella merdequi]